VEGVEEGVEAGAGITPQLAAIAKQFGVGTEAKALQPTRLIHPYKVIDWLRDCGCAISTGQRENGGIVRQLFVGPPRSTAGQALTGLCPVEVFVCLHIIVDAGPLGA